MTRETRIDQLIRRWLDAHHQGVQLTPEELCRDQPQLVEEVRARLRRFEQTSFSGECTESPEDGQTLAGSPPSFAKAAVVAQPLTSNDQFLHVLAQWELVPAQELTQLRTHHGKGDPGTLAELLVSQKKLTRYQAKALLEGTGQPLRLDRYVILDVVDSGGMGVVYRASHQTMGRIVALKTLPPETMQAPEKVTRFQREVRALARLQHPNVVTIFDAHESGGTHFLVMELVQGRDLQTLIEEKGPMDLTQATRCILQAARGLEHAHSQGIIHRDVKPANLILSRKGLIKVLDLSLARIAIPDSKPLHDPRNVTREGMIMGTVNYVSPEQALDPHHADARSDVYSLGCTYFYLLTGQPPFQEENVVKTLMAHCNNPVPDVRQLCPELPETFSPILQKMLAKNPDDRPQTMTEVLALLRPWSSGDAVQQAAPRAEPQTKPAQRTTSQKPAAGPWKWKLLLSALLGAAAVVLGVILLRARTEIGTIVLEVDQDDLKGATVSIDGKKKITIDPGRGKEIIEIEADGAKRLLKVTKGGFQTFTRELTAKAGKQTIRVRLEPLPKNEARTKIRLLIPAYFHPVTGKQNWEKLLRASESHEVIAVVNPASGPGEKPDPSYVSLLKKAESSQLKLLGYVTTDYAKRDLSAVKEDVDRWLRFYPQIDGFFLDSQASSAKHLKYYQDLSRYVLQNRKDLLLVSNPGTDCDPELYQQTPIDAFCRSEGKKVHWAEGEKLAGDREVILVYGIGKAEQMQQIVEEAKKRKVGYLFVTEDVLPNPWDSLPTYWDAELTSVQK